MPAVAERHDGVSVGQAGALAVRRRYVHGVDAEDVRHRGQLGGRPPPVERHRATVVKGFEDTGEFCLVRPGGGVEVLDRVLDEILCRFVGGRHPAAGVLDAPRPGCEPIEVGEIDRRAAQIDDRGNIRACRQRPGRESIRLHRSHYPGSVYGEV